MQFDAADIKGDAAKAAEFNLGIFGMISGDGTILFGPVGSGRKVSWADEGYRTKRGATNTFREASAHDPRLECVEVKEGN